MNKKNMFWKVQETYTRNDHNDLSSHTLVGLFFNRINCVLYDSLVTTNQLHPLYILTRHLLQ